MQRAAIQPHQKPRLNPYSACALPGAIVCMYFTGLIYYYNANFIESPFGYIALILVPFWLLITTILLIPFWLLQGKGRQVYITSIASCGIVGWIIGTFLFSQRGLLDGQELLRSDSLMYQRVELAAVIAALIVLVFVGLRWQKTLALTVFVFHFMSVAMFVTALLSDKKSYSPRSNRGAFYDVSSQKNAFVFIFDGFPSHLFENILKRNKSLREKLDGFTYFPDSTGVAPTTYLSIPAMHSGIEYREGMALIEYYKRTVVTNSFLTKLAQAGYDAAGLNFVNASTPQNVSNYYWKYMVDGFWQATAKEGFYLFDISLYRAVPSRMKDAIYNKENWFLLHLLFRTSQAQEQNRLLELIGEKFRGVRHQPSVRWIHLFNTHPPASLDANCNLHPYRKWTIETAEDQATCSLKTFVDTLDRFRQNGIYDNSLIILTADHGRKFSIDGKPPIFESAHPLFLAKPFDMHGSLQTSGNSVYLTDLPQTICSVTRDCVIPNGVSAFQNKPKGRSIRFNDYRWKHELWGAPFVPIQESFTVVGPVDDPLSWYREIPAHRIRTLNLQFSSEDQAEPFGFGWARVQQTKYGEVRWVVGSTAQLYLPLKQSKSATLEVTISTHAGNKEQFATLFVNQKQIDRQAVPVGQPQMVSFSIPGEFVTTPVTRLTFLFDKSNKPKKDFRKLAAAFYELNVSYK